MATPTDKPYLTDAAAFRDVSRGNPKPFTLKGDDLDKARLTPETWRLEIVSDGSTNLAKPRKLEDALLHQHANEKGYLLGVFSTEGLVTTP